MKLGATGQALLWLKPYRNLSSRIGGVVSLHETGGVPATALAKTDRKLCWYRAADTAELGYSSGFGPIPAEVGTRAHGAATTSAALAAALGLTQERFRNVVIEGGGLPDPSWSTTLPETLALDASFNLAAVPIPGRLMAPWQGSVNPKIGSFSGTLDVAASASGIKPGKAAVSGVLYPSAEVDTVVGAGLVKIPVVGKPGAFRTGAIVMAKKLPEISTIHIEAGDLPTSSWSGVQSVAAFRMGRTEITWSEFQTTRTWAAENGYDIGRVGAGNGPKQPVTNVSWHQALKWCNARSEQEGLAPVYKLGAGVYRFGSSVPTIDPTANGYRLPIEKEWEFTARGGVKTNGYEYSGSNDIDAVAWYDTNIGTRDVATKQPNELGLSDMSGNVWEWCFDASGSDRVGRGGSWDGSVAGDWRVADRSFRNPSDSGTYIGFRIARSYVP
jgi:formylglycine-generating enzyme required for sulfatase activity